MQSMICRLCPRRMDHEKKRIADFITRTVIIMAAASIVFWTVDGNAESLNQNPIGQTQTVEAGVVSGVQDTAQNSSGLSLSRLLVFTAEYENSPVMTFEERTGAGIIQHENDISANSTTANGATADNPSGPSVGFASSLGAFATLVEGGFRSEGSTSNGATGYGLDSLGNGRLSVWAEGVYRPVETGGAGSADQDASGEGEQSFSYNYDTRSDAYTYHFNGVLGPPSSFYE